MFTHFHRAVNHPPGSHLIGEGSRLLIVPALVIAPFSVAALLPVLGLVAPLGAGVFLLLAVPLLFVALLAEGVGRRGFLGRGRVGAGEGSQPAGLLEEEPQVSSPQDQVDEAKHLEECGGLRRQGDISAVWISVYFVYIYSLTFVW